MQWPTGFMWGTGASSTQREGAAPASDWFDWERAGHAPISDDGNGFGARYAEDFALLAGHLRRGLDETAAAMARGIDVRGFFHWTAVDNYEWLHGYDVAFGIIDRDRNVRASARILGSR